MDSRQWMDLYRDMLRIRRVEEVVADLYPQQEMRCPVHLCIGQEAAPVGVCGAMEARDYVFSTHRSHGHYLAKGGDLTALLGELYGRAVGCSMGKGGSMHMIDLACGFLGAAPILGATASLAVGAAFGVKAKGEDRVTVAFFGDAAVEEGIFYESANFAALHKLPVVFVCENNQLSTCSPLSVRQPAGRTVAGLARGIGLESATGDGNDVLDVTRLAREAIDRARSGSGPTLLELHTYRWREHCGPSYDVAMGYRTQAEVDAWEAKCPIVRLQASLSESGAWDAAVAGRVRHEIDAEIERCVAAARRSPFPGRDQLMSHEYAA